MGEPAFDYSIAADSVDHLGAFLHGVDLVGVVMQAMMR